MITTEQSQASGVGFAQLKAFWNAEHLCAARQSLVSSEYKSRVQ